ncbi:conjugal transfer protein, partial [Mumia sp.]|uniref:conjugal transfer protein n=1 Tax=Mumia sp. TaxID=1965300 RepID=UPI00260C5BCB
MRLTRNPDKRREAGRGPTEGWPDPGTSPPEVELLGGGDTVLSTAYGVSPVRPLAQLAARVGLWGAVGIGVVGGLVGILRPPVQQVEAVAEQSDDDTVVPAPVAGVAELVVQEWLTVDDDREDEVIEALFVEPPDALGASQGNLAVGRVTTVSGEARHEGYWAVTVAAEVTESIPLPEGEPGDAGDGLEHVGTTWFVEVAIVGDTDGRLAALTTPAIVPPPPEVVTGWYASTDRPRPAEEGPLTTAVEGFLGALLAGGGDPSRYLAPGGELSAVSPVPFVEVRLVQMSADDLGDGRTRVLAEIDATTRGGTTTRLTYEIVLEEWADRWEITQFSGAPTLLVGEPPPEDADDADDEEAPGGGVPGDGETPDDQAPADSGATPDDEAPAERDGGDV